MTGIVFDIKRFAIHDGPGIRTTVFLKGCSLSCWWCHNPEGIGPAIEYVPKTVKIGAKSFEETEQVGRKVRVDELLDEVLKDRIFMEESGGGVTFSGGEPLRQPAFLLEALKACKGAGLHTTVDTSGYSSWKPLEKVAGYTDLFLFDLKIMDEEQHRHVTGVSNKLIKENLIRLLSMGKNVRIRIPVIPGFSFSEVNIAQTLEFLEEHTAKPEGVDLLPYHNTATHKYTRFGQENRMKNLQSLKKEDLNDLKNRFEKVGFITNIGG